MQLESENSSVATGSAMFTSYMASRGDISHLQTIEACDVTACEDC